MEITVYYNGIWNKIAMWTLIQEKNGNIYFQYNKDFLSEYWNISAKELHPTLNKQWPFPDYLDNLPWIVYDCLPDWWWRIVIDRYIEEKFKIDRSDAHIFLKLLLLDNNAIWGLSFEPREEFDINPSELPNLSWVYSIIKEFDLNSESNNKDLSSLLATSASLWWARPKILCFYKNDNGNLRISNTYFDWSESYIIKFNADSDEQYSILMEYIYMTFAKQIWSDTPHVDLLEVEEWIYALAIKRFDRIETNNGTQKVLMHSLAGALHTNFRMPSFNYDWFLKMTGFFTQSYTQVELAFERAVFNIIFGNKDDHTKNFSYIFTKNKNWVLSPAYDLTLNNWLNWNHQMDVLWKTNNITRQDLIMLWQSNWINNSEELINKVFNTYKQMVVFVKTNYSNIVPKKVINDLERKATEW